MEMVEKLDTDTPQILLEACCADPWNRADLVLTLWSLVGRGHIGMDLEEKLTMSSTLWRSR